MAVPAQAFSAFPLLPEIPDRNKWALWWNIDEEKDVPLKRSRDSFCWFGKLQLEGFTGVLISRGTEFGVGSNFMHEMREILECESFLALVCVSLGLHDGVSSELPPLTLDYDENVKSYGRVLLVYLGILVICAPKAANLWTKDLIDTFLRRVCVIARTKLRQWNMQDENITKLHTCIAWHKGCRGPHIQMSKRQGGGGTYNHPLTDFCIMDATKKDRRSRSPPVHPPAHILYPDAYKND